MQHGRPGSPLSPVLGGEGSGVRGEVTACLYSLSPAPLPRVQGRGEKLAYVGLTPKLSIKSVRRYSAETSCNLPSLPWSFLRCLYKRPRPNLRLTAKPSARRWPRPCR